MQDEGFGDDVRRPHAWVQRLVRLLEDDPHLGSQATQHLAAARQDLLAVEADATRGRFQQPEDAAGGCGLAGPALADEPERLPRLDAERDVVDGVKRAPVGQCEVLGQRVDLEQGAHRDSIVSIVDGRAGPRGQWQKVSWLSLK